MEANGRKISPGEFFSECGMLLSARSDVYKDAWIHMSLEEIAAGIRLKAGRINALLKVNGEREKLIDDLKDLVNYCYFLYAKLVKGAEEDG